MFKQVHAFSNTSNGVDLTSSRCSVWEHVSVYYFDAFSPQRCGVENENQSSKCLKLLGTVGIGGALGTFSHVNQSANRPRYPSNAKHFPLTLHNDSLQTLLTEM